MKVSNFDSDGAAIWTSPASIASRTWSSLYRVEFGYTSTQAVPFISSFTRSANRLAAIPLGCLSVLVTWLNLMTISPSSQAAEAAPAVTVRATATAVAVRNFIGTSQSSLEFQERTPLRWGHADESEKPDQQPPSKELNFIILQIFSAC